MPEIIVLQKDFENGIDVQLELSTFKVELPFHITCTHLYKSLVRSSLEDLNSGKFFNGETIVPVQIDNRKGIIKVKATKSDYLQGTILSAYNSMTFNPKVYNYQNPILHPTSSLGADVCVISNEGKILAGVRSLEVDKWAGMNFVGLGEGLDKEDAPNFSKGALRCLSEELGLSIEKHVLETPGVLKCVAFGLEVSRVAWTAFYVLDLRGLGEQYNTKNLRGGIGFDSWENNQIQYISIEQFKHMRAGKGTWVPSTEIFGDYLFKNLFD